MPLETSVANLSPFVQQRIPEVTDISDTLWNFNEIGLTEARSSAYLRKVLAANGFTLTHEGAGGMPTAFVAEYGSDGPTVGILGEFDALPSLGNEAVPFQQSRADGQTNGHGCGHNLIASGSVGAALALKDWLVASGTPGKIRYLGCPAEENWCGKVLMAREGLFDGLDAAVHWHPLDRAVVANIRTTAVAIFTITFRGKTAHAGNDPWNGRSALHALELFAHGVNLMREHMRPTARTHYIFGATGTAANVVTDLTSIDIRYRDVSTEWLREGIEWIQNIADGAAQATQTTVNVRFETGANEIVPNAPLAGRAQAILDLIGAPSYTKEEQTFAKEIQRNAGLPDVGMCTTIVPLQPEPAAGGSSDVGDVSKITPTMGVTMPTMPEGGSLHTWLATASHGMSIGHKGAIQVAHVLAALGAEILTDPELRSAAMADFRKRVGEDPYRAVYPDDVTGLPEGGIDSLMPKTDADEFAIAS